MRSNIQERVQLLSIGLCSMLVVATGNILPGAAQTKSKNDPNQKEWRQLFNGKDLKDWYPKITGYDLNDNFGNTFRVENGLLKVGYDKYDKFDNKFGHIFHREKFSHYIIAVEYRFIGEQCTGGPNWEPCKVGICLICKTPNPEAKQKV